jgi:hypothetical protein
VDVRTSVQLAYLAFLRRKIECLCLDVLLWKHKQRLTILHGTSVRAPGRGELGVYQCCVFLPSEQQRFEDSLGSGASRYRIFVLDPSLGRVKFTIKCTLTNSLTMYVLKSDHALNGRNLPKRRSG